MTSAERVTATLTGAPVDRRAVTAVLSLYGARLTGCPLATYFTDAREYVRGQEAVSATFDPDILFAPFDFAAIGAAFGSEIRYYADQAPNLSRTVIASADEWARVAIPDPDSHPLLVYFREAVRALAARGAGAAPVGVPLPPLIDLPALIMGMGGWMETVLFDEDGARRILDALAPFMRRFVNALFADGAAIVVFPCSYASHATVTREIVERITGPALRAMLTDLNGPVVLHHGGAPILDHLDLLAHAPNTVAYVVDECEDLDEARRIVGSDPVLLTGPMAPRMPEYTEAEVERICRAKLGNRRGDARFALCNAGPDIPWNTPPENLHAMRRAVETCGAA